MCRLNGTLNSLAYSNAFLNTINLANNDFSGPLPAGLMQLTSLARLDLSYNRLSWGLPYDEHDYIDFRYGVPLPPFRQLHKRVYHVHELLMHMCSGVHPLGTPLLETLRGEKVHCPWHCVVCAATCLAYRHSRCRAIFSPAPYLRPWPSCPTWSPSTWSTTS